MRQRAAAVGLVLMAAAGASGCGDDADDGGADRAAGAVVAEEAGCVACHGEGGEGGVGPAWVGLAGSTVELEDGRELVADEAYIRRAILAPGEDLVAGYTVRMPEVELGDDQVDALVAYISGLGEDAGNPDGAATD